MSKTRKGSCPTAMAQRLRNVKHVDDNGGRNSSVAVRLQTSRISPTSKRVGFKDSAIEECKEEQRPGL